MLHRKLLYLTQHEIFMIFKSEFKGFEIFTNSPGGKMSLFVLQIFTNLIIHFYTLRSGLLSRFEFIKFDGS